MKYWVVAGALQGAMLGVFAALEFTDHVAFCVPGGMVGACAGSLLVFQMLRRNSE